ncbi:MAG: 3-dehydroquinate synthase [Verrucomicrobia bacterium]|nr:MAG: 3-dehydroquinate synthase [Verrucomicrobiota bacterium]
MLRLARRNHDIRSGQHDRHIQRHNDQRRSETLVPDAIEEAVSKITVSVGRERYRVLIGEGLLKQLGKHVRKYLSRKTCAIIADDEVAQLFARRVERNLISTGFHPTLITIPAGEKSKTLTQAGAICDQMIGAGLDRQSFVVGIGGGVIGDISGFVAAIYQRGIPHVQIPGVNTRDGKNLIGAVHHPSLVIDDTDVLKTLPRREFNQAFAEIIKHAVIADAKMFRTLKVARAFWPAAAGETHALQSLIKRNIEIKSKIVAKDERDQTGQRALLNFGHTVGHAIERAGDYRKFLHGEALSLGIVAAGAISIKRAGLSPDQREAIVDLLRQFELPTRLPKNFQREKIFSALKFDKKFKGGKVRFVVTR